MKLSAGGRAGSPWGAPGSALQPCRLTSHLHSSQSGWRAPWVREASQALMAGCGVGQPGAAATFLCFRPGSGVSSRPRKRPSELQPCGRSSWGVKPLAAVQAVCACVLCVCAVCACVLCVSAVCVHARACAPGQCWVHKGERGSLAAWGASQVLSLLWGRLGLQSWMRLEGVLGAGGWGLGAGQGKSSTRGRGPRPWAAPHQSGGGVWPSPWRVFRAALDSRLGGSRAPPS